MKIRSAIVLGMTLLFGGVAFAQDYPKIETAPAFMYIRMSPNLTNSFVVNGQTITGSQGINCAGGGGTIAYNLSSLVGIAADLGGCKVFSNAYGLGNTINGNLFTYLFGPRLTFRNSSKFEPFAELNFGGTRIALSCQSSASNCLTAVGGGTYSKNAFALTVGGGFQIKINKKVSLRLVQAEYLYTRFGNGCAIALTCNNNNNQNSFRLKSG
ncbi:MAG TPA: outer membrane beta-barrel protein, partial [Candidatus Acidoferrum sp.]